MAAPSSRLIFGLLPWYGVLIVVGISLAVLLASREANRLHLPEDTVIDLALRVLPLGILGARLYYVAFSWPVFRTHPLSVLYIWEGGLAVYGGIIAGLLTAFVFCRRRHIRFDMMLDILAPGVALAQAIGRWGNYFNQEAYGIPVSIPAFRFFPLSVLISESGVPVWHAAAFFYESVLDFGIFCFLLWGRRYFFRCPGDVFGSYAMLYAAGRLLIENLRTDSLYLSGRIRVSQLLSLMICFVFFLMLAFRRQASGTGFQLRFFSVLPFLPGIPVLFFCLGWCPPLLASVKSQLLLLGAFSLLNTLSAIVLYQQDQTSEVIYANHEMEK